MLRSPTRQTGTSFVSAQITATSTGSNTSTYEVHAVLIFQYTIADEGKRLDVRTAGRDPQGRNVEIFWTLERGTLPS